MLNSLSSHYLHPIYIGFLWVLKIVTLQGYGHYFPNDQSVNEPLEETMGKLLEINPTAASLLLDSRGLSIMPLPLAEGLPQVL